MKKIFVFLASLILSVTMLFAGCSFFGNDGVDGRDGKDGHSVTIEDIYRKYVSEHGDISFEDFLREYLSYTDGELNEATSLRATINRSLMSGVTILTRFAYTTHRPGVFGDVKETTHKIFTGSGAILWMDKSAGDAYVVTNCHVIYDDSSDDIYCPDIRLYLYGQDVSDVNYIITGNDITKDENYRIPAEIVGAAANYDIALLKVSGSSVLKRSDAVAVSDKESVTEAFKYSFVQEDEAVVGETVYAIGNASGEGMSASAGIISKDSEEISVSLSETNTKLQYDFRVLRTSAPINHGNSGGGLYNTSGKLVAIVQAKDEGEGIDNMGYALPACMVRRLVVSMYESFVNNGNRPISVNGKKCGVYIADLNIKTLVSDSYARLNGDGIAVITELIKVNNIEGRPARGNLELGDILVSAKLMSADGTEKENVNLTRDYILAEMLISARAGDVLTIMVERNNTEVPVSITFDNSCFKYYE